MKQYLESELAISSVAMKVGNYPAIYIIPTLLVVGLSQSHLIGSWCSLYLEYFRAEFISSYFFSTILNFIFSASLISSNADGTNG
jgi:hypothetical protein